MSRRAEARSELLCAAALAALPWIVFLPVATLGRTFALIDLQFYFHPYHVAAAAVLESGQLPLWNPYAFSGIPLLGDGQAALLHPASWLFFFLPAGAALNFDVLLQFSIGGVGAFLAARNLGADRAPAAIGAVAFMLGGFMTARLIILSIMSTAAMIPWIFLAVDRVIRGGSRRAIAGGALAVALQVFAGHPQLPLYTGLAVGLYGLVVVATPGEGRPRLAPAVFGVAAVYGLGLGIAALQLLPWAELARFSPRAEQAGFELVFGNSMAPADWLLLGFPYLRGSIDAGPFGEAALSSALAIASWERATYLGLLPLALAALAFCPARASEPPSAQPPHGARAALLAVVVATVVFAMGKHTPLGEVFHRIPLLGQFRDPGRILGVTSFALAMLATLGAQRVAKGLTRTAAWASAVLLVVLPVLVVFAAPKLGLDPADVERLAADRPNAWLPMAVGVASGVLLWVWWRARDPRWAWGALAVVALDVGVASRSFVPMDDAAVWRARPPAADVITADPVPDRCRKLTFFDLSWRDVALARDRLSVSWGMVYGIEDANGFNSLQPRRYTDFLFGRDATDVSYGAFTDPRVLQADWPVLHALCVKYLLFPGRGGFEVPDHLRLRYRDERVAIYENLAVWPRAWFADRVVAETDPEAVLAAVTAVGFDRHTETRVEALEAPVGEARGDAEVVTGTWSPNRIVLRVRTDDPRLLVVSEMHYPGWVARIGGREVPIHRANYLFRSVVVPPGDHDVEFVYRPRPVVWGLGITLASLGVAGWLGVRGAARPRRP